MRSKCSWSDLFYCLQLSDTHSTVVCLCIYLFIDHRRTYYLRTEIVCVLFIGALIPGGNPIAENKYSIISRVSYRPIVPVLQIVQAYAAC